MYSKDVRKPDAQNLPPPSTYANHHPRRLLRPAITRRQRASTGAPSASAERRGVSMPRRISASCRVSDMQCRCQPRRGPGFCCRLGLQPRSRRPAADLGERLRRVLHQPGATQSDLDGSAGRRSCCLRFQHLDEYFRSCPHRNAGRPSCRVRGRRQYRNQRRGSCYRPGGHYAFRHRYAGWNRLRLRRHGHRRNPGRRGWRLGRLFHQRRVWRT